MLEKYTLVALEGVKRGAEELCSDDFDTEDRVEMLCELIADLCCAITDDPRLSGGQDASELYEENERIIERSRKDLRALEKRDANAH